MFYLIKKNTRKNILIIASLLVFIAPNLTHAFGGSFLESVTCKVFFFVKQDCDPEKKESVEEKKDVVSSASQSSTKTVKQSQPASVLGAVTHKNSDGGVQKELAQAKPSLQAQYTTTLSNLGVGPSYLSVSPAYLETRLAQFKKELEATRGTTIVQRDNNEGLRRSIRKQIDNIYDSLNDNIRDSEESILASIPGIIEEELVDSNYSGLFSQVGVGTATPLADLDVEGDVILSGSSRYLNFGNTSGTAGYGFRDNAGTLEFKDSGGAWAGFGGGNPFDQDLNTTDSPSFAELSVSGTTVDVNSQQAIYIPGGDFIGTSYYGDGGGSLLSSGGVTGSYNTAVGIGSLYSNTTGHENSSLGYQSLYSNTTGYRNAALGYQSLYSNTSGRENIAQGYQSLYSNTTGQSNIAQGYRALYDNTSGSNNISIGASALVNNTTGASNIAIGTSALSNNSTGLFNVAQGYQSLFYNNESSNTAIGYRSLYNNTSGASNTALGRQAGQYTSAFGANVSSGTSLYIGAQTRALADGAANEVIIGYDAVGNGSNTVTLGNDSITDTFLKGEVGIGITPLEALHVSGTIRSSDLSGGATNLTTDANGNIIRDPSDIKLKKNINTLEGSLDKVLALRGVSYEWKDTERFGSQKEIGFIAQEVEEVVPEVVRSGGEYKSINTRNLIAVAIGGIQDLYQMVIDLGDKIVSKIGVFGEVETNKLCVEGVCIDGAQLETLLKNSGYSQEDFSNNNNSNDEENLVEESQNEEEDNESSSGGGSEENSSEEPAQEEVVEETLPEEEEQEEVPEEQSSEEEEQEQEEVIEEEVVEESTEEETPTVEESPSEAEEEEAPQQEETPEETPEPEPQEEVTE